MDESGPKQRPIKTCCRVHHPIVNDEWPQMMNDDDI